MCGGGLGELCTRASFFPPLILAKFDKSNTVVYLFVSFNFEFHFMIIYCLILVNSLFYDDLLIGK